MNEFTEYEFKYNAENISLAAFQDLMEKLKYNKKIIVSSWDVYYCNSNYDFMRFRESPESPELTIKRKTTKTNNWNRIECDLPLSNKYPLEQLRGVVRKFAELEGYKENFKIYKTCVVFILDEVNYVYYQVYDENMKELGKYIEVEILKDKILGLKNTLESTLRYHESILKKLEINPQNRMKKSLFELYVNENV